MKVIVYHRYYGCETGCCGHAVAVVPDDFKMDEEDRNYSCYDSDFEVRGSFDFYHPYGDNHLEYAKNLLRNALGEEHIKDLDWDNCIIAED